MAQYVVAAGDRAWFARCRRAWDLGAACRQGLEPRDAVNGDRETLARAMRDALAVHYFPGMWSWDRAIVEPLVFAAYDRADGPPGHRPLVEAFLRWATPVDQLTPLRVEVDIDVHVPDPVLPHTHLSTTDGAAVRYRDRIALVMVDVDDRSWIGDHRLVDEFASHDELVLDERGILACWAWDEIELATTVAGMQYTEIRVDPPAIRRTVVARSDVEKARAASRLGRTALEMLAPDLAIEPTPEWAHCSRCSFRTPCMAMNRGEDARAMLMTQYRPRGPDVLEEGRLGGVSWGMGRGAAPPRW
jgi:hypothetical protein